jgi:hypothetical protein
MQDYAASMEQDIQSTQDQIQKAEDETHITFLSDHLNMLRFELDKTNAEMYLFQRKKKEIALFWCIQGV